MATESFQYYVPRPPLSNFVGVFWHWQGYEQAVGRENCLPSGTSELVVSLHHLNPAGAVIGGARSDSFILERTEQDCLFGIHFNPGGAFSFLGIPAIELEGKNLLLMIFGQESLNASNRVCLKSSQCLSGFMSWRAGFLKS